MLEQAQRRQFSTEYKLGILRAADACSQAGEVSALLRHEGLYSSLLSAWRRQREQGALEALRPRKRGRKTIPKEATSLENERLRKENAPLQQRPEQAERIIESRRTPGESPEPPRVRRERLMEAIGRCAPSVSTKVACEALGVPWASGKRHRSSCAHGSIYLLSFTPGS